MIATPEKIKGQILTFANGDDPEFDNWPVSQTQASLEWAEVISVCAREVVPASSTESIAKQAFITQFNNMSISAQNGYQIFQLALKDYATLLAQGMQASGFLGIPPPQLFVFNMQGLISGSSETEALKLATELVAWFKTGTATNISTGATINWT